MQKDIERGNIAAIATIRQQAYDHAKGLVEPLRDARQALRSSGHGDNYSAIARWLNAKGLKTVRGVEFKSQTITNLFTLTEETIGKSAITECDTEIAILAYEFEHLPLTEQTPNRADADNAAIDRFKANCLHRLREAILLGRELRGENDISAARLREDAIDLEKRLRDVMLKSKATKKLYARRVVSASHERRKRQPIEVRRARAEARKLAQEHEQPRLDIDGG